MSRVREFLGEGGAIARRLSDYEERPEQIQMAEAVEKAIAERKHLVAEAGTGVGKSFAYLLPAVLHADSHQETGPVVISTRTIALQQQLEQKDLPFLHAVLPFEWSSVTAIGRSHYVCLRRMHHAHADNPLFEDRDVAAELRRIVEWSTHTREGTRFDLPEPVRDEVWEEVQAEHGNCLNKACSHYEVCPWQRARRRMQTAQVLVVNHALYCADLALRRAGASYLPDHQVVIFDEAHHLERTATEALGLRIGPGSVHWHLRRLSPRRGERGLLRRHGSTQANLMAEEVRMASEAFFAELEQRLDRAGSTDGLELGNETVDQQVSHLLEQLALEVIACSSRVEKLDARMELQARATGLSALAASLRSLCEPKAADAVPHVRWIERSRKGALICGAPLEVSAALRESLFASGRTVVMTSATLGPVDDSDFTWLRRQLGVTDNVSTLRLGSPFDYRSAVQLVVEEAMPDPSRDPSGFRAEACDRTLRHLLDNGGSGLVLCTSWEVVRWFAERMREPLAEAGIQLLVQGEAPLARLLEQKRADVHSVLIGTDSLWEGIDIRGEALTLVVVTRLPFGSPGHPLTKARLRAIEQRGGDPFLEQSLPEAILRFRQGFGRLIRSSKDRGKVVILDPRARTKAYGRRFLQSLPVAFDASEPPAE
ncbi:MAG: putative ATP-dependent helicase DinG [Planctomycetota bacterium]|jgi:ATP-dependent DNA helicase DinG